MPSLFPIPSFPSRVIVPGQPLSVLPRWLRRSSVCLQCRRPGFRPWVRKIPWRREWQPTPVLLPGKGWRPLSSPSCSQTTGVAPGGEEQGREVRNEQLVDPWGGSRGGICGEEECGSLHSVWASRCASATRELQLKGVCW